MTLTIDTTKVRSNASGDQPTTAGQSQLKETPPTVERWLGVVYGIGPNPAFRATPAPISHRYPGGIAEWLGRMWGISVGGTPSAVTVDHWLETMWAIRPGRSFPTNSTTASVPYPEGVAEWLHQMWGLTVTQATTTATAP